MKYGPNLKKIWDKMPESKKQAVKERAKELREEYIALQELRKELNITQEEMAEALDIHQVNVSQLERRSDMKISTLRDYLSALGGELEISVRFPGQTPKFIRGIGA